MNVTFEHIADIRQFTSNDMVRQTLENVAATLQAICDGKPPEGVQPDDFTVETLAQAYLARAQSALASLHPSPAAQPPRPSPRLRILGVMRLRDAPTALTVVFTDIPTDDDLRSIHEFLKLWAPES